MSVRPATVSRTGAGSRPKRADPLRPKCDCVPVHEGSDGPGVQPRAQLARATHDEGTEPGGNVSRTRDPHPECDDQRKQGKQSDAQSQEENHRVEDVLRRITGQRRRSNLVQVEGPADKARYRRAPGRPPDPAATRQAPAVFVGSAGCPRPAAPSPPTAANSPPCSADSSANQRAAARLRCQPISLIAPPAPSTPPGDRRRPDGP